MKLEGFNPLSFQTIPGLPPWFDWDATFYIGDGKNIFFGATKMIGVDYKSFKVIDRTDYSKDQNHVYFNGEIIVWADSKTFNYIDWDAFSQYARDKNSVYINWKKKDWVNADTFEYIWSTWLDENYTKDKDNVYYNNQLIEWADTKTFTVTNTNSGELTTTTVSDKDCIYQKNECIGENKK